MKNILVFTSLISLLVLCGCDHMHDNTDKNPPVITMETPNDNQIIKSAGIVNITGKVKDEGLHELTIRVTTENSRKSYFFEKPMVHDSMHYSINKSFNLDFKLSQKTTIQINLSNILVSR